MNTYSDDDSKIEETLLKWYGAERFHPGLDHLKKRWAPLIQRAPFKSVIIAGTNGKGEAALACTAELKEHGAPPVYTWMSPHILTPRERLRKNGYPISPNEMKGLMEEVRSHRGAEGLSYYEFLFECFLTWSLREDEKKLLVLEVGLGGRLDATNAIDADIMGLTSIGRDHQEFLGEGLNEILFEKFGVSRKNTPFISSLPPGPLQIELSNLAQERSVPLFSLFEQSDTFRTMNYSEQNQLLGRTLAHMLLGAESLSYGLEKALKGALRVFPGRMQSIVWNETIYTFSGSHNFEGLRALANRLLESDNHLPFDSMAFALSKRPSWELKAISRLMKATPCLAKKRILVSFGHPRSMDRDEETRFADQLGWPIVQGPQEFISQKPGDRCLVVGSYYFLGEFQKYLAGLGASLSLS